MFKLYRLWNGAFSIERREKEISNIQRSIAMRCLLCTVTKVYQNEEPTIKTGASSSSQGKSWINLRATNGSRGIVVGMRDARCEWRLARLHVYYTFIMCKRTLDSDTIKSIIKLGAPPMHKSKKTGKCYGTHHSKVRLDSLGILPKARVKHTRNVKRWIYIQTIGVRTDEHGKGHGKNVTYD